MSCSWSLYSVYKDVLYVSTYYKPNLTSCALILYSNCPADARRLILATSWYDVGFLPNLSSTNMNNLSNYLDTIIAAADAFQPTVNFTTVSVVASSAYVAISSTDKSSYYFIYSNSIIDKSNYTLMLLNSTQLRVDCNVNMTNTQMPFKWFNLTFISNQSESKNFYIDMSKIYRQEMISSISNGFLFII